MVSMKRGALVALKRWDEVKEGKLYYYVGSLENPFFRKGRGRGGHKKTIGGNCLKRGVWTICWFTEGGWQKRAMHFM